MDNKTAQMGKILEYIDNYYLKTSQGSLLFAKRDEFNETIYLVPESKISRYESECREDIWLLYKDLILIKNHGFTEHKKSKLMKKLYKQ